MAAKRRPPLPEPRRYYHEGNIPLRAIRRFARRVAERFKPDKIILYGSYAYGTPHADSDVDILVVMPCRNQIDQAIRIRWEVPAPFPMDLIVRTPQNLGWRVAEKESFHTEIVTKGKVLYEKDDAGVGAKGRGRLSARRNNRPRKRTLSTRAAPPRNLGDLLLRVADAQHLGRFSVEAAQVGSH
jgi:predicted nucleotidyltransferase